jgi:hypothetical protein
MSSENENTNLESNIQFSIEDISTIIEESTNSVVDIPVEFTLSHVEEMVQPDAGLFFSINTEEPLTETPLVVLEPVVEETVAQVEETVTQEK